MLVGIYLIFEEEISKQNSFDLSLRDLCHEFDRYLSRFFWVIVM